MARIIVCGYMVRYPVAGNMLAYFHYVLGLHLLGHSVIYLEESGWPYSCYDPASGRWQDSPHVGLSLVRELFARHDVPAPVWYVNRETRQVDGTDWQGLEEALRSADLLLNIGGVCWLPEFIQCGRRALVDMDPLFSQVGEFGARLSGGYEAYDACFSYGANIGRPGCMVPTLGMEWLPTVPPVVPDLWQWAAPAPDASFTTIANWQAYGSVTYEGERYGQKDEEFMRFISLPRATSQKLELALSGASASVVEHLRASGWAVRDASRPVGTDLEAYRLYISHSRGEFSVAKNAYVKTRSGWFSDRSVCYLASGLPVVLQETGFSDWLPTGLGVLPFSTLEEAADCIRRLNADYAAHRRAAREIAEAVFSHEVVLPRLLESALHTPHRPVKAAQPEGTL